MTAWTTPALLVAVAGQVFQGTPGAPLLVLAAVVAPLVALLRPVSARSGRTGAIIVALAGGSTGLVLWANFLLVAELAALAGLERWQGIVPTVLLAAGLASGRGLARGLLLAGLVGVGGLAAPIVVMAVGAKLPPWMAWRDVASRGALAFDGRSGRDTLVAGGELLTFTEPHRVTAGSAGVYRVTERDRDVVVRDWRLSVGDSLLLRPGDELLVEADARLRFEPGRRVPGASVSGVTWADPRERHTARALMESLGAAVTLVGGALALVRPPARLSRSGMVVAPILVLTAILTAVAWGVYGVHFAPDLGLAATPVSMMVGVPGRMLDAPVGVAMGLVVAGLLGVLVLASAGSLRESLDSLAVPGPAAPPPWARALWPGVLGAAAILSLWPADPWRVLTGGLGLAASAVSVPLLAGGDQRTRLAGALAGGVVFGLLASPAIRLPAWADWLGAWPALLAAPLAWAVVAVLRRRRGRRPPGVRVADRLAR